MEQSPFDSAASTATDAMYGQFGVAASYTPNGGTAAAVTILVDSRTTAMADKQATRARTVTLTGSVRVSEVSALGRGDTFTLDGETLVFRVTPSSVTNDGLEWDFQASAEVVTAVGAPGVIPDM